MYSLNGDFFIITSKSDALKKCNKNIVLYYCKKKTHGDIIFSCVQSDNICKDIASHKFYKQRQV